MTEILKAANARLAIPAKLPGELFCRLANGGTSRLDGRDVEVLLKMFLHLRAVADFVVISFLLLGDEQFDVLAVLFGVARQIVKQTLAFPLGHHPVGQCAILSGFHAISESRPGLQGKGE